ncbi:MAG: C-terminal binding protein [Candidatus Acidiferrales bacterium]
MKIINTDSYFNDIRGYGYEQRLAKKLGASLILATVHEEPDIIAACARCEIVLVEHADTPVNKNVIAHLDACQLIVKYAVGVDNVDISAATQRGIVVCHTPNFCIEEVSDHAVALLLALARRVVQFNDHVRAGGWAEPTIDPPLRRMRNRVVGLVGFGRIARLVAQKMSEFGVKILAFDPFLDPKTIEERGAKPVDLEALFAKSDYISVHTPLTKDTRHLIGAKLLARMKPTSFLINTSRGPVIDEAALCDALRETRIAGAALDVTEIEPLPGSSPLRSFRNVILTPHYAANSIESLEDLRYEGAAAIEAYCKGFWPEFVVNPQVQPKRALAPWKEFEAKADRLARLDASGQLVDIV